MSQHKTGQSNYTPEQKELYQKRRSMNLRGQIGYANIHQQVLTDHGPEAIPQGFKKPRKSKRNR